MNFCLSCWQALLVEEATGTNVNLQNQLNDAMMKRNDALAMKQEMQLKITENTNQIENLKS